MKHPVPLEPTAYKYLNNSPYYRSGLCYYILKGLNINF
jgi:hypothetical protein